jgi:hypothetical protein
MPNPYLSGRIPVELDKQVNEFLARTGETKTQMLIKAVSAYIGTEPPPLKAAGDRRIENIELELAELKGGLQSLYEMFVAFTSKIENPKVELEPITTCDNIVDNNDNTEEIDKIDQTLTDIEDAIDSNDNSVEIEKANPGDNSVDNIDNKVELSPAAEVTPTSDDGKTFIHIETAEAARLTKLHPKRFTSFRHSYNQKLKKQNQSLPEKQRLDSPIKMTPASGVKIEKVPYDIFYVGHSEEGRNLWNLVPITTVGEDVPLPFATDNIR